MNTYNLYDEGNRKHNYHTHIYLVIHKDSIDESIMCKIKLQHILYKEYRTINKHNSHKNESMI